MNRADYARMVEQCSRQVDAMQPGPERDALIEKTRQYQSYAKMQKLGRVEGATTTRLICSGPVSGEQLGTDGDELQVGRGSTKWLCSTKFMGSEDAAQRSRPR